MTDRLDVRRVNRLMSALFAQMRGLDDDGRDQPIRWNVMHMYSGAQLAKLIAMRRGMDMELASLAAALHDIAVVATKKSEGHAQAAEPFVRDEIRAFNENNAGKMTITPAEQDMIVGAVAAHSDKDKDSGDAFTELLKDVDALDRWLHGVKSAPDYMARVSRTLAELGVSVH